MSDGNPSQCISYLIIVEGIKHLEGGWGRWWRSGSAIVCACWLSPHCSAGAVVNGADVTWHLQDHD